MKLYPVILGIEEREDFSRADNRNRKKTHKEERGFELLQGSEIFQGGLLGGCLEKPL